MSESAFSNLESNFEEFPPNQIESPLILFDLTQIRIEFWIARPKTAESRIAFFFKFDLGVIWFGFKLFTLHYPISSSGAVLTAFIGQAIRGWYERTHGDQNMPRARTISHTPADHFQVP